MYQNGERLFRKTLPCPGDRRLPLPNERGEFDALAYDFVGPTAERRASSKRAMQVKSLTHAHAAPSNGKAILLDPGGNLRRAEFQRLLGLRDETPIELRE